MFVQVFSLITPISAFPISILYFDCCCWLLPKVKSNALNTSFTWNEADIVKVMNVAQHKSSATSDIILWADHYVKVMTADHLNACFKVVCCTM